MFLFSEGFRPQNVHILFLTYMKHSYLLATKKQKKVYSINKFNRNMISGKQSYDCFTLDYLSFLVGIHLEYIWNTPDNNWALLKKCHCFGIIAFTYT